MKGHERKADGERGPPPTVDGGRHLHEPKTRVWVMEESLERGGKGERVCWNEDAENQPAHSGAVRMGLGVQLNHHCSPQKAG